MATPFSPTARSIAGVIFISVMLAIYLGLTVQIAVALVASRDGIAIAMGVALFVLPVIGAWSLLRELVFGLQSAKLTRILATEGKLPEDDLPHLPSGRTIRDAADEAFPAYATEVETSPASWQAWFRLGLAYDACGDRRRARSAIRKSISLFRR